MSSNERETDALVDVARVDAQPLEVRFGQVFDVVTHRLKRRVEKVEI